MGDRMTRYAAFTAPIAALSLIAASPGLAHHVPPALQRVEVIKRIYPDLYRGELAEARPSWERLRVKAATRYGWQHPVAFYSAHPSPLGNRWLARHMFGPAGYACASVIINGETGGTWRHDIAYGFRYGPQWIYSGLAYGLGQAKPGTKMLRYGADAATNPSTQLTWFRAYAQGRYGSICGAAAHWTPNRSW